MGIVDPLREGGILGVYWGLLYLLREGGILGVYGDCRPSEGRENFRCILGDAIPSDRRENFRCVGGYIDHRTSIEPDSNAISKRRYLYCRISNMDNLISAIL